MIIKNKLDKLFGPSASFSGLFILIIGIGIVIFQSFVGLILVAIGAFTAFSSTSAYIDLENKKVRFTNNLFGLIPIGKWLTINPEMKLTLKKVNRVYRAYSRSNRSTSINKKDIRLLLYINNRKSIYLRKFDNLDIARNELEKLKEQLGI